LERINSFGGASILSPSIVERYIERRDCWFPDNRKIRRVKKEKRKEKCLRK